MSTSNDAPGGAATEQANVQTVIEARIDPDEVPHLTEPSN